jgi:NADPH:quinone reductase-like Zn-dependent oxidoreductase
VPASSCRPRHGGQEHIQACRRILLTGGIYVSSDLRPFAQNLALPFATRVGRRPRRRVVFPLPIETLEILEHLRSRLESGAFRPIIDRTYPLEDIVEAHRYVESDQKVGKVVIDVRTD